ncbi:acyltransferase family protein [Flavobacterium restrictum]|uniref:Acyltransferase n=1 Tax=Flavobacterium restrictum TaxID=2594428 RepID=A0A553E6I9_9FLAO|nr:acyltransferase [Flavobacterium restrictum]TRX40453.1 acyltransferase [Flavobacterium restrictum]
MNKNCFDFLRMFFSVTILLAHLGELSQHKSFEFLHRIANSTIAVQGFFIISGFLVAKSYTNTPSLKNYFIKRAKRIVPAYVFLLFFTVLALSFFSQVSALDYFSSSETYAYLGWNLFFFNFMHPCLPGLFTGNLLCAVNGSLWTLKIEEGFYVLLPFLFYVLHKIKKPFVVLFTLYFLSLLYWYVMEDFFNKPLLAKQLPGYLAYFVVGIYLYLNIEKVLKHKVKLFLIAVVAFVIANYFTLPIDVVHPAAFGTGLIIAAFSLPFLNNFGKYGDFTYGIYIYHFPIIQLFRQYNLFEKYNPILMAIGVSILTILLAVFSWYGIEKRFLDRYKKGISPILS